MYCVCDCVVINVVGRWCIGCCGWVNYWCCGCFWFNWSIGCVGCESGSSGVGEISENEEINNELNYNLELFMY